MKLSIKLTALLLALMMILPAFAACKTGDTEGTTEENTTQEVTVAPLPDPDRTEPAEGAKIYSIIFALATVPPVLAALDSIANGYETYAIIERGKTYNGIEKIENFNNAGFDPANNLSNGFTSTEFNAMVDKIKELRAAEENSFFYIYAQDGTALRSAALAANAGIPATDFHVVMCEDGTGAYNALRDSYVKDKVVSEEADAPFNAFAEACEKAKADFTAVMSKNDNKNSDKILAYSIKDAFALAALPNFTYWMQDRDWVKGILENAEGGKTALLGVFGFDDAETEYSANLRFASISEMMDKLSEKQRTDYLTLMYGDYFADTFAALTRTERAGEKAPAEKLVFIGARHNYYPKFASNAKYGIGGLAAGAEVPKSYSELDSKYKTALLFATEADYNAFLAVINDNANYPENAPEDVKAEIRVACFNLYIDYIYTLKFTYALYGERYDIILKGHPREVIGAHEEWGGRNNVVRKAGEGDAATETKYCYDKMVDLALLAFHGGDSVGKYIGMVPYGTAAENLAYLGVDISIAGLPSSTYSGYDTDVDVLFIISETDESIDGDASQVKDRFASGNLTYTEGEETFNCVYYNTGNLYKYVAQILKNGNAEVSAQFEKLFKDWLAANRGGALDIDAQGFAK